jgi:hypothetical protein
MHKFISNYLKGVSVSTVVLPAGTIVTDETNGNLYIHDGVTPGGVQLAGTSSGSAGPITYAQLPTELASLPLAFMLPGQPSAGAVFNLVLPFGVTIPALLAGAVVYAGTAATANAIFTVNKLSGGVVTALGTVTITAGSHTATSLAGAGGSLAGGNVIQLSAPTPQDASLADIGISLLAGRV